MRRCTLFGWAILAIAMALSVASIPSAVAASAPVAPGSPNLTGRINGTQITLNWTPGPGDTPTNYTLQVALDEVFTQLIVNQSFGAGTGAVATAPFGFTAVARVIASNSVGQAISNSFRIEIGASGESDTH